MVNVPDYFYEFGQYAYAAASAIMDKIDPDSDNEKWETKIIADGKNSIVIIFNIKFVLNGHFVVLELGYSTMCSKNYYMINFGNRQVHSGYYSSAFHVNEVVDLVIAGCNNETLVSS